MGDVGIESIFKSLTGNTSLAKLWLCRTGLTLTDDGLLPITRSLKQIACLEDMDISGNSTTDAGLTPLLSILPRGIKFSLRHLEHQSTFSENMCCPIENCCDRNDKVTTVPSDIVEWITDLKVKIWWI